MKKTLSVLISALLILSAASCGENTPKAADTTTDNTSITEEVTSAAEPETEISDMRDITTMELVKEMGYGINLGNTFEACGDWINSETADNYITAWGSPVITKEIINTYAASNDTQFCLLEDGTYTISSEYRRRVKEAVDWTLDTGMYAIINIHWDNGWVNAFPENEDESMKRFTTMWTQIA